MPNRFRNPVMRREYDAAVRAWQTRHKSLVQADGSPLRGSSVAAAFWDGFQGERGPGLGYAGDAASRELLVYAWFRAGQDCRQMADAAAVKKD